MKIRVTFTVEVDAEEWCEYYGVATHSEVRESVRSYYLNEARQAHPAESVGAKVRRSGGAR